MATNTKWWDLGVVNTEANSKNVSGVGTAWKAQVNSGDIFTINGEHIFEVETVVSDTAIVLKKPFTTKLSSSPYAIIRNFTSTLPAELAAKLAEMQRKWYTNVDEYVAVLTSKDEKTSITDKDGVKQTVDTWNTVQTKVNNAVSQLLDSSVPYPDVWIPFSSNLRMIEGVGGDVKVGDVTVANLANFERATTATYIDKSGALKTAAINEPRFEKEGLLLEGQSTNLFTKSEVFAREDIFVQSGNTLDEFTVSDVGGFKRYKIKVGKGSADFAQFDIRTMQGILETSTVSAFVKVNNSSTTRIKGRNLSTEAIPASSELKRVSYTENAGSVSVFHYIGFRANGGDLDIDVYALQQEALPFASSYIPTSGSAVTRAADKCWIQLANNANTMGDITFSTQFDLKKTYTSGSGDASNYRQTIFSSSTNSLRNCLQLHPSAGVGFNYVTRWGDDGYVSNLVGAVMSNTPSGVLSMRKDTTKGRNAVYLNGRLDSGEIQQSVDQVFTDKIILGDTNTPDSRKCIWGHIRNFRIWHSALSDEQIKTLK